MQTIVLLLLPFWTPLIPPMGLACLKGFLQKYGFRVKTADLNVEESFRKTYDTYFSTLKQYIPTNKQGNFFNIGIDVLQDHMTAAVYFQPEPHDDPHNKDKHPPGKDSPYTRLLKDLVSNTFFHQLTAQQVCELDHIIREFFLRLEEFILELVEKEKPGILGISVYKGTFAASMFGFRLIKQRFPHIKTIMGGGIFADQLALGSPNFDVFLDKTPFIDNIFVGEAELLFLKWLKNELPPEQRVFTRADTGSQVLDLDSVEMPDFSDFNLEYYSELAAYTSRSCPFQCGFCAETVNWGKYRRKKANQVAQELSRLYEKYGMQLFLMSDSILNPIASDLAKELINLDVALYWDGYIRADKEVCDPETTMLWRRGGLYRARLGIESGSEKVLEKMNKRLTPQQIKSALFNLSHAGIKTSTYWVIGYPGETEQDFQETLNILEELKDHIYEAECNPFRYYPTGQVKSSEWGETYKSLPLYPVTAADHLVIQTWILDGPGPSREEIYNRVARFTGHCEKLGIPNPYSWQEIYRADERWKKLHANAVAPFIRFKTGKNYIDECKHVEKLILLQDIQQDEGDFDF